MASLDSTGLTIDTLQTILDAINTEQQQDLGADWDISETSPEGVMNGIVASKIADMHELLALVYNAFFPDSSPGVSLDRLAELTGSTREAAKNSTVSVVCVGTNGTLLSAGRVVSVTNAGPKFQSLADATIATLSAWAGSTAYAVGALRTNDSGKIYSCTIAGTSSGGPTGTGTAISDGTCTWRYIATASAAVAVAFQSEDTGAIVANAGTLSVIETAVGNWTSALNPLDATLGQDQETDAVFRARRTDELTVEGASALDALRSDILAVSGVTACTVFENVTDSTDGNGLPPHSVECVVNGGTDQAVLNALLSSKAGGINTYGNTSGTALDANGTSRTLSFTRPVAKPIYITVDVTVLGTATPTVTAYPSDGDTQIKNNLVAYGLTLGSGDDVIRSHLFKPVDSVAGVYDITAMKLDFSASPVATANLAIAIREQATFDTSRIVLNKTVI